MNPSWYDLLDVETDASTDEIRAAWKAAIADLDPADRRFRVLNQATEVLLDPSARAAYDKALAPEPPVVEAPRGTSGASTTGGEPDTEPSDVEPVKTPVAEERSKPEPGKAIAGWVPAVVAVLTAVMVGLAGWQASRPSETAVADATSGAQAAAEAAAATILSYDYRTMDEDQTAAGELMTADYRKEYDRLFSALEADAAEVEIQVSTELVASGIERAGAERVTVVVFVNRPTLNAQLTEPVVYRDQVTMTMENIDGVWLVDGMGTSPVEA